MTAYLKVLLYEILRCHSGWYSHLFIFIPIIAVLFSPELLAELDNQEEDSLLAMEMCRQDNLYGLYFRQINAGRIQARDR